MLTGNRPHLPTASLILMGILLIMYACNSTSVSKVSQVSPKIESSQDIIELKIDSILALMTLQEKIGQTAQRGKSSRVKDIPPELKEALKKGEIGSFLNVTSKEDVTELQRIAVEESPRGIPLIFARDVIHGYKTIFPIPLGQAATFNPSLTEKGARIAAIEASSNGIRWTFAPMLDISRDPRWGRISESGGEDPYLTSRMAEAYVKGFQGDDLTDPTSIAACAKHFVGYGAAEGGRDYNTANINDFSLHNNYLKPFKASVDAGVATFMSGFNEVNGVPASGNQYLMRSILREEWGFDGFVVSDWESIIEMIPHGFAADEKHAAALGANAMVDMEMTSTSYQQYLAELIAEGKVSEEILDEMVRNILRIKYRLGLFDNPYFDPSDEKLYAPEHLDAAKQSALESMVLLKNNRNTLPLGRTKKIALIGPLADKGHEQLGTWTFDGEKNKTITPKMALQKDRSLDVTFSEGLSFSRDLNKDKFEAAIQTAESADVIVFCAGEEAILSGEAHSRADISLPGAQEELILELAKTGKPIILVVMAGRPITFERIIDKVDAVIMAWHPGTMGGPALKDILIGDASPSGKLPVTWPKMNGQMPIYYNHKMTGRPVKPDEFVEMYEIPIEAWQSSLGNTTHYLDAGYLPAFPFGFGMSYSSFDYSNITLSSTKITKDEALTVTVTVKNTGNYQAQETVQLYFRDMVGSLTRPVKELLRFEKVLLKPGESKNLSFTFTAQELAFYGPSKKWIVEPGTFKLWVAKHAMDTTNELEFTLE